MSLHGSHQHHAPARHRSWEWWLISALALVAAGFGAYGMHAYDLKHADHGDWWSVGYHTLQLFFLHAPHLDHQVPWQLNLGRWFAALVVLIAVLKGLVKVFSLESRLIRARWGGGHVVICGLGRVGLQLAREYRARGTKVVAIDATSPDEHRAIAHDIGVAVLEGDARDPAELRRAAVGRAKQVIAVCDDEQSNVAVASTIGSLLAKKKNADPLECWMFVPDPHLRRVFQQPRLFPHTGPHYEVNVRGLDLVDVAARQALARSPLDFDRIKEDDRTVVHLVVVGFGTMGQRLALQAAKIGHFANEERVRLNLTVVTTQGDPRPGKFLSDYPAVERICEWRAVTVSTDVPDPSQLTTLARRQAGVTELTTFALCWDSSEGSASAESDMFERLERDDPKNLSLALDLATKLADSDARILVLQTRKRGFGALFGIQDRGTAIAPRMQAFGMLEDLCSLQTLLHESDDAIAKVLHRIYFENQTNLGHAPGSKAAICEWENLGEDYKDSNRQAADHIAVKLRAINLRVDLPRNDKMPMTVIHRGPYGDVKNGVDLLGKMEHRRWCAEKWLDGWTLGDVRDDSHKRHPCLIPWDKLDEETRNWDRQQVEAIPAALERAGYCIYSS